jgi:hypothetical protein
LRGKIGLAFKIDLKNHGDNFSRCGKWSRFQRKSGGFAHVTSLRSRGLSVVATATSQLPTRCVSGDISSHAIARAMLFQQAPISQNIFLNMSHC